MKILRLELINISVRGYPPASYLENLVQAYLELRPDGISSNSLSASDLSRGSIEN